MVRLRIVGIRIRLSARQNSHEFCYEGTSGKVAGPLIVAGILSRSGIRENSAVVRLRIVGICSAPFGSARRGRMLTTRRLAEFSRILLQGNEW